MQNQALPVIDTYFCIQLEVDRSNVISWNITLAYLHILIENLYNITKVVAILDSMNTEFQ